MTKLDSLAAWQAATRMVTANRDVLIAIAGVFFLLPALVRAVFVPQPEVAPGTPPAAIMQALMDSYGHAAPLLLLLSLLQMVGMLTVMIVIMDPARPTVGAAIRRSFGAIPGYLGAQLLIFVGLFLMMLVCLPLLGAVLPAQLAVPMTLAILAYPALRTMLIGPVMAGGGERNPITAIRKSLALTRHNTARLAGFLSLAVLLFLVIYGLVMMFVGVVLVLATAGETQRLLGEAGSSLLLTVASTYFAAMLAAVHRQLSDSGHPDMTTTFE